MQLTDEVLYQVAQDCDFTSPFRNTRLVTRMLKFMRRNQGIGLAAPQVGMPLRMFVMEIGGENRACWNPRIVSSSQESSQYTEGCLSFPGEYCNITRPAEIEVEYQNCRGDMRRETLTGLWARCFQHELDHLDGITMKQREQEAQ